MVKYILKIKHHFFFQFFYVLIANASLALVPLLYAFAFDGNIVSLASLIWVILIFVFLVAIHCLFAYFHSIQLWKGGIAFEKQLKQDFFSATMSMKYQDFSKVQIGEYVSRLSKDISLVETDYLMPLKDMINSLFTILVYTVVLVIFVDFRIALTLFITSIMAIYIAEKNAGLLSEKKKTFTDFTAHYVAKVTDVLGGKKLVSTITMPAFLRIHDESLESMQSKRFSYGKLKSMILAINGFSLLMIRILSFGVAIYLMHIGEISVGVAVATLGYADSFLSPLHSIIYDVNTLKSTQSVKNYILSTINEKQKQASKDKKPKQLQRFNNNITFENINFMCSNFELLNVNLTFEKGKKYAIIGPNGSGKSTLLNILAKILEPSEGNVFIDGENINDVDISKVIGYVNQNEHIFDASFEDNISVFGAFDIYEPKRVIDVYGKIKNNKSSKDLSGGEQQILAILRLLSAESDIFLLDEPFSAMHLDMIPVAKDLLFENKEKTIIMITHENNDKLSDFDEVIYVKDGRITKFNEGANEVDEIAK